MAAADRADICTVHGSGEACSARDRCPNSAGKLSVRGRRRGGSGEGWRGAEREAERQRAIRGGAGGGDGGGDEMTLLSPRADVAYRRHHSSLGPANDRSYPLFFFKSTTFYL